MTVKDFLQSLGGAAQVSRELGVPYTTVAQWQQSDRIPAWRIARVADLALSKGKSLPESIQSRAA